MGLRRGYGVQNAVPPQRNITCQQVCFNVIGAEFLQFLQSEGIRFHRYSRLRHEPTRTNRHDSSSGSFASSFAPTGSSSTGKSRFLFVFFFSLPSFFAASAAASAASFAFCSFSCSSFAAAFFFLASSLAAYRYQALLSIPQFRKSQFCTLALAFFFSAGSIFS